MAAPTRPAPAAVPGGPGVDSGRRRGGTIVALVHNGYTHDSRVRNEASSLALSGRRVTVVAVLEKGLAEHEEGEGFDVVRVRYNPPDTRFWRNRDRVARPIRHRATYAAWVKRSFAGPRSAVRGPTALILGILTLPWVAVTTACLLVLRAADRVAGAVPRRPSAVISGWTGEHVHRMLFAAHRPLRVRDWGRRVGAAVARGSIPVADVWHAHDLETLPVALDLARRFGGRVVYDSHEVFVEAAGRARLAPWRRRLLRRFEARWIRDIDAMVTVNDAVAAELARRYRVPEPLVVRNCPPAWSPPAGFRSPLLDALVTAVDDPGLPVVLAHGSFQLHRGFEELLEAAEEIPGLNVVFLGYGGQADTYHALAAMPPWRGRLAVLPAVPPGELVAWVAGSSFAACLIQPTTLNHRLSTPNKLFEAIAAGVPILASDLPAISTIIRSTGAGVLVPPTDISAIREGLRQLLEDPDHRARLATAAREAARTELNWEHESQRLTGLYDRLLDGRV